MYLQSNPKINLKNSKLSNKIGSVKIVVFR